MSGPQQPVVAQWLAEPMPSDVTRAIERLERSDDVQHIAIMPDVHLGHDVCVGLVVGTSQFVYPAAVGGDIGCGLAAIALSADAEFLASDTRAAQVLSSLYQFVPSNRHCRATRRELPRQLRTTPLSHHALQRLASRDGRVQFATLGRGNHFLEFQADEASRLWLMVHTGSRAMGQAIRAQHLKHGVRTSAGLIAVDGNSPAGQAYLHDVMWARQYAFENRSAILETTVDILRRQFSIATVDSSCVNIDHNHVQRESHFGRELWVHRKGASDAHTGRPVLIPGSMGTASFHAQGRGNPQALSSSSHGAGRRLSRDVARRTIPARQLIRQLRGVWFDQRTVHHLREEAPDAYKDIHAVMRAQCDLIRIIRRLRPLLSFKGH